MAWSIIKVLLWGLRSLVGCESVFLSSNVDGPRHVSIRLGSSFEDYNIARERMWDILERYQLLIYILGPSVVVTERVIVER